MLKTLAYAAAIATASSFIHGQPLAGAAAGSLLVMVHVELIFVFV